VARHLWVTVPVLISCGSLPDAFESILQTNGSEDIEAHDVGDIRDTFNGVHVYYNGQFSQTHGRNTVDEYNLGLKYQCVEFVKRYYFFVYEHRMPNTWGHARDFYDKALSDGEFNEERGLTQHLNGGESRPRVGDIVVFSATLFNPYGHLAIISDVSDESIEVVQQNTRTTRSSIKIEDTHIDDDRIDGWLSIES